MPPIGSDIGANSYYEVGWHYNVPDGYEILSLTVTHSGNHLAVPFGVYADKVEGTAIITVRLSNVASYDLTDIFPQVLVLLRRK